MRSDEADEAMKPLQVLLFTVTFVVIICVFFLNVLLTNEDEAVGTKPNTARAGEALKVADIKINGGEIVTSSSQLRRPLDESTTSTSSNSKIKKKKVAYAITVTKDGPFVDGAVVLGYAAKKFHDASKGFQSPYEADLVAFVVPGVVTARPILESHGWRILERGLPVELSDIKNKDYAEKMRNSGCCGADEFLKLWAYTLEEYHRVVHLDMDSIIFKSMVKEGT